MSNYTPGPLFVSVEDKWPFSIVTTNSAGTVVFKRDMPCNSTSHRNAKDAIAAVDTPAEWFGAEANARAIADETLRAAAPDLLEALQALLPGAEAMGWDTTKARAAINKATGEQA